MPDRIARVWNGSSWEAVSAQVSSPNSVVNFQPTAPSSPITGQIWIDSDDDKMYVWNGSAWDAVTVDKLSTVNGTISLPSTTSIGNVSDTEISYLDGVTSSIQTQFSNIQTQFSNKLDKNFFYSEFTVASGSTVTPWTLTTWTTALLTTATENSIPGASISAGVITLPAGKYYARGYARSYSGNGTSAHSRIRNVTSNTTLLTGVANFADTTGGGWGHNEVTGFFTLASTTNISLQAYVSNATAIRGATSGESSVIASIVIQKIT